MKKVPLTVGAAVAALVVLAPASASGQTVGDAVSGAGFSANTTGDPSFGTHFEITATSDAIGAGAAGQASVTFTTAAFENTLEGTVSCLAVSGSQAVIGIAGTNTGGIPAGWFLYVVDGGPAGSGLDRIEFLTTFSAGLGNIVPTDCAAAPPRAGFPVTQGDITVTDTSPFPTAQRQCKNGGWRNYPGFKNQGQCVSFVATGGKNQPAG